jgi:hypothetical protein
MRSVTIEIQNAGWVSTGTISIQFINNEYAVEKIFELAGAIQETIINRGVSSFSLFRYLRARL